ncbi:hypothetical protein [Methylobacterium frigidaeris]|uniref:Nitrate reductase n=1 Tax=Methylobacterium frigidaeris TaxID=2038277 RepID=A0AA37HBV7_9HYPH|nr:hypothetical protein [Methylobacterium frigidaeris]PIK70100.1 hypothetical protein CS379_26475 [Methylobacterium frigidaeris]GJD63132.1 hypothetical protein MPEAHAMD_3294 [Methylobacterium frigidaeris]
MSLLGAFRKRPAAETGARARVADIARRLGGFSPEVALTVNEIVCADPACPGTETVILVMPPGARSRACKVGKPLEAVTEEDVAAALEC